MKNVKSVTLSVVACVTLLLTGCDKKEDVSSDTTTEQQSKESGSFFDKIVGNPNIDSVKNGTLPQYSESLTVGNTLDHWKGCSNPTWEAETTERGERFVKFSCDVDIKNVKSECALTYQVRGEASEGKCEADESAIQHLTQVKFGFIFALSTDSTSFTPLKHTKTYIFDDGKQYMYDSSLDNGLGDAYGNNPAETVISSSDYDERQ